MSRMCEQQDRAKIEDRAKRRRERACFWSWPWGHCTHWRIDDTLTMWGECCRCGKHSISLPPGGPYLVKGRRTS